MIAWLIASVLLLTDASLTGTVHDSSGAAVSGAVVIVRPTTGAERQAVTGPDGHFFVAVPVGGDVTIVVRAGGFGEQIRQLAEADRARDVDVVLAPAPVLETVMVTPTRSEQRAGDVPASISVISRDEIKQSPAVVADDVLRQIPTFSLFRRTSSLSSHPTAQGVSLRGIGPSGVSRTLVLVDGIPFNDPFGGWVYWTRVPLESVDRIEVVDGSSSSLYGNYAMGGVINIVGSRPARRTVEFKPQYGNHHSPKIDVFGSDVWGKLGFAVEGSAFDTEGFPIVAASERGIIDNSATVTFKNVNVKLDYSPTPVMQTFFRAGSFREDRGNGKILEVNDTRWTSASGGLRFRLPDTSNVESSVFVDVERFHSTFLAVTAPSATVVARSIVRLTTDQVVPTHAAGWSFQWSRAFGRHDALSAGMDWRWVQGDSEEDGFNAAPGPVVPPIQQVVQALRRVSGGTQKGYGVFVQDIMTQLPRLTVTLSARLDRWRNYDAHNFETNVPSGTPTSNDRLLPDGEASIISPRVAALYHLTDRINVWGDSGSAFRAPTLNELYRQFRVGTVSTLANELLGPERLYGSELGVTVTPLRTVTVRTTLFDNRIAHPISNVTLSTVGVNVTQQRQNLGGTRIRGLQTDVDYRLGPSWRVSGGYLFNQATVEEFAANNTLVGNTLPQVPAHRASLQVGYANPRYATVALGLQYVGRQFDDDQNTRAVPGESTPGLPGYTVVDLMLSRTMRRNVDVFLGAQNLFDREYFVGTLPTTIGSPRLVNGGVRVRLSGR